MEKIERILVFRSDRIGDMVLTLPIFSALRQGFPHAHIGAFVAPNTACLLEHNPDVDEILLDERSPDREGPAAFIDTAKTIKTRSFDTAVMPYCTWRIASLAMSARIKRRVANGYRSFLPLINRPLWLHRSHPPIHETEYVLAHLRPLGIEPNAPSIPLLSVSEEELDEIDGVLRSRKIDPKDSLLCIHPGTVSSAFPLSPDRWVHIASLATAIFSSSTLIITGSMDERPLAERIGATLGPSTHVLAGELTLRQLMALQKRLDLFIAPSTGPLHTAAALGTRTLGLFPPVRSMSPVKWRPLGLRTSVLTPNQDECDRCITERCAHYPCMDAFSDEMLYQGIESLKNQ